MLKQVRRTLDRYRMLSPGERVVVAVSGGPDSAALLHVLHTLAPQYKLGLHVLHLHHGLRGADADADAAFVQELAARLGWPCTVRYADVGAVARSRRTSIQDAARQARYAALDELQHSLPAERVALGHQRDDQAETVLLRLIRGSGPQGLAGIPPVRNGVYIRPLIEVRRTAIEDYCRQVGLQPRRDRSNQSRRYWRSRVRHQLLPLLEREYNDNIVDILARTAAVLRDEDAWLASQAAAVLDQVASDAAQGICLDRSALLDQPTPVARRLVRLAAARLLPPGQELGFVAVERVLEQAATTRATAELHLPGGLQAIFAAGAVHICRRPGPARSAPALPYYRLQVPGVTTAPATGWRFETVVEPAAAATTDHGAGDDDRLSVAFDLDSLPGPLAVRCRRPGDRFYPQGMQGSKKLQDWLVDAKVPRAERDRVPLLVAGDALLWVVGRRVDRRWPPRPGRPQVVIRASEIQ